MVTVKVLALKLAIKTLMCLHQNWLLSGLWDPCDLGITLAHHSCNLPTHPPGQLAFELPGLLSLPPVCVTGAGFVWTLGIQTPAFMANIMTTESPAFPSLLSHLGCEWTGALESLGQVQGGS